MLYSKDLTRKPSANVITGSPLNMRGMFNIELRLGTWEIQFHHIPIPPSEDITRRKPARTPTRDDAQSNSYRSPFHAT